MATTVLPMALAKRMPIWPKPPTPTMPTLFPPVVAFQVLRGENMVMPAQRMGPAASRG